MKLASILLSGTVEPWEALGFATGEDGRLGFANGLLEFGHEVTGLSVTGDSVAGDDVGPPLVVDGITISVGTVRDASDHPNGAIELDHVVIMTDSLDRTSAAIEAALGLPQRRVRETDVVRQAFHRFDDHDGACGCIIEIVESPRAEHPAIWGVVVNVSDLDAAVALAPHLVGRPKPAVQPGRWIATVSRSSEVGTALALMSR